MIIKKFQAGTETEAMMLAKEELGKDAIVMNIKTIKPKGLYKLFKKPTIEITAAIDDNVSFQTDNSLEKKQEEKQKEQKIYNKDILLEEAKEELEEKETAIEQKLNDLQNLLEKQMQMKEESIVDENETESSKKIACIQLIYNQLINNEVDEKYANQLVSEIEKVLKEDSTVDNALACIYQKIILKLGQPKTIEVEKGQPKFIFFIGPTGVGKTTTIAKIASNFSIEKKVKIALVTSDTYRIAAVEQLRTYANILGIPVYVVYSEEDMKQAKKEFASYDLVLIDTAGRNHKNREQRDDIERLLSTIPKEERDVYLVLSATTKYRDLIKITEAYSKSIEYKLIFTKLDETGSIGNIYNIKMLTQAPLSYTSWGQNVPDDISKVDAQDIAKKLLGGKD